MAKSNPPAAKKQRNKRIFTTVITLIFFFIAYLFWAFPFRASLSYREQMQLFLTTSGYFQQFLSWPGGMVTYIGEFLTQFFNNYYIGAAIISLLLTLTLTATKSLCHKISPSTSGSLNLTLSFIPAIALWLYLGNPAVMLSFVLAIMASMSFCLILPGNKTSYPITIICLTLLYWLIGSAVTISAVLVIIMQLAQKTDKRDKIIFTIVTLVTVTANILIWSRFLTYPFSYQLIGKGYLLIPDSLTNGQIAVMAACIAAPLMALLLKNVKSNIPAINSAIATIAVAVIVYPLSFDKATYKLINYDYYVRTNNWQGLIDYASKNAPDLPLSVSATNLALGMTGQLDSQAFRFFQNGPEGLVPVFTKETLSSFTTGEILFQLGMINDAQRFYFEGMEAIPNYNKSSRAVRRLAETAMIRGDRKVAEKYLNLLSHTTFYKKWARRNLELMKTPGGVDNHPLYGALKRHAPDNDYLYSEGEIDKSIGQMYLKDPTNALAKQYLIVYPLLERNLDKFMQYMQVIVDSDPTYNPPLAGQAAAFYFMKNGMTPPAGLISQAITRHLQQFSQAWSTKDPAALIPFSGTLYYYLMQPSMAAQ